MSAKPPPASRRAAKRARWFHQGAKALSHVYADAGGRYACPLCLRAHSQPEAFTFEHVPPECLGGRPLVLTCPDCNRDAGLSLDHHARAGEDAREFVAGKRPIRATVAVDGAAVRVDFWRKPDCNSLVVVPGCSNPQHEAALQDRFRRAAATGETDWTLNLSWTIRHNAQKEYLSWLRAAYLAAFAALGYRYICSPALEVVRRQIKAPNETLSPQTSATDTDTARDPGFRRMMLAREPTRCIIVQFGARILFLPNLSSGLDFYESLKASRHSVSRADCRGREIPWPAGPVHALDYAPSLIARFMSPDQQEREP